MREDIIIDFQVDDSQLVAALDRLEKSGAIDSRLAHDFKAIGTASKTAGTEVKGLVKTFSDVKGAASVMGKSVKQAFDQGVTDALKKAGVSAHEFEAALKKANTPVVSLRAELRNLTQAIAEAKVNGKDLGAEFVAMQKRAGLLKDALQDAGREISNIGSDTRGIDNVIGSVGALAGGFAVAQGAASLFGSENEDLQKALLKVNGAMAISQGLQVISNALTKEGSLTKLADATATGFQSAAQTIYTAVTGRATAATLAFKAALLATGIGAVVVLILSLVGAFSDAGDEAFDLSKEVEKLGDSFDKAQKQVQDFQDQLEFEGDVAIERLKRQGASETQLHNAKQANLKLRADASLTEYNNEIIRINNLEKANDVLNEKTLSDLKAIGFTDKQIESERVRLREKSNIEIEKLREKASSESKKHNTLDHQITLEGEQFETKLHEDGIEDRKKAMEKADADARKRAEDEKKRLQELRDVRLAQLNDELAAIEIRRLKIEQGSQGEVDIQKEIIRKKLQIDLEGEKLTINQKRLLRAKALDDQLKLQTEFNSLQTKEAIQGLISRNNAELSQIGINGEEKLRLTIENIQAAAQIEREANLNNASKLLEINAKAAADIKAVKLAFSEKTLEDEISLNTSRTGAAHRALEAMAQDEKQSAEKRIAAIQSILTEDSRVINQRILNLEDQLAWNLISEQEYNLRLAKLIDDRIKIKENAAVKENEINTKSIKDREDKEKEAIDRILATASQVSGLLNQLSQLASANETERIEGMKRELQELEEAGAITKKNAEIRAKQIEIAERQAKQRQAKRNKELALFEAIINTARAIAEASPNPFLIALAAALGAAQIALIVARPIPKFAKGKKDNYEGPGIVGEAGTELVERNGKMYITTKPTVMFLGKKDKVFNPSETKVMMHNSRLIDQPKPTGLSIDYDKLGKVMSKNKSDTSINIDRNFISESVANGLNKNNYFNQRYKF